MPANPTHPHDKPASQHDRDATIAFGRRLRQLRAETGLSQDDLARRTGMHPTAIGRLEHGGREPRLTTILRLAHALNHQPDTLLQPNTTPQPDKTP